MLFKTTISNQISIKSLTDLPILKKLEDYGSMKVNRSKIARELGIDRRTVAKYMDGFQKKETKNKKSIIDDYYDTIKDLLSDKNRQVFFYKRVLWQYLKDNHGLSCAQSTFRHWISKHEEFQSYFNGESNRVVNGEKVSARAKKHIIHYETFPGEEAQLDWKESMNFVLSTGEVVTINICALVYSYSRFKIYQLSLTKTQTVLFHLLDQAFEIAGGIPRRLRTDNMKTVMDEARTKYSKGKINRRFKQFADDYGFIVTPCIAAQPQVKAKVEAPMKVLDELYAYNGQFDLSQLNHKIQEINNRLNYQCHVETGKTPILHIEKEKDSLLSLPPDNIRNLYRIPSSTVKVNSQSMISYSGKFFSVPTQYLGKNLTIQVYDDYLHVYDNTKLVTIHQLSNAIRRYYHQNHYVDIVSQGLGKESNDIKEFAKNNLKQMGDLFS